MSSTPTIAPPPGMNDTGGTPTSPQAASPAPPTPSPAMQSGTQDILTVTSTLRRIAKAYPQSVPFIQQINDLMRDVSASMMQSQQPGEPQAPPTGG